MLVDDFRGYLRKMAHLNEASAVMAWDLRTGAPTKGVQYRSEVVGTLSSEAFKMSVGDEMVRFVNDLSQSAVWKDLDAVSKACVKECSINLSRNKSIPEDRYKAFVVLTTTAESVWQEAREKSDFAMFEPYLVQIVDFVREFADRRGYEGHPYNDCLQDYERGMRVDKLDTVFGALRPKLVDLLNRIMSEGEKPSVDILPKNVDVHAQKEFCKYAMTELGYDLQAGRLDESAHPFSIGLNPGDVRITTRYAEDDFLSAVLGTIHECGHAIYEQNIGKELVGTPLWRGASMGIHESQSLFSERFVGRSLGFWKRCLPVLDGMSKGAFRGIETFEFYRAINIVQPSLIRVDADELTYPLHIILRYELEKGLLSGDIKVSELPELWNAKMDEYLGITPPDDAHGVLQDIHWSGGALGYFPSYALGFIYASQLKAAMSAQLGDVEGLVEAGDIGPVKEWLTENIHRYGVTKTPEELIVGATGQGLDTSPLMSDLEKKYSGIYRLR